jgi:hypothetical protein
LSSSSSSPLEPSNLLHDDCGSPQQIDTARSGLVRDEILMSIVDDIYLLSEKCKEKGEKTN